MDVQTLTAFFMWCTILNGAVFALWSLFGIFAPDFVYRTQSAWFPISRPVFDGVLYGFLALFKIVFVAFSLTPWLALLIVG